MKRKPKAKPKPKIGRPPKITLAVVQAIGKLIALGMTEEQACLAQDASYGAFKKAEQRNPAFVLAIKKAQADFLQVALSTIAQGGDTDALGRRPWTGLAWILERRHKPQFNRGETAGGGPEGGAVLTEAQFAELSKCAREMFVK